MSSLRQIWFRVRASFWFVPSLTVAASIAAAIGLVRWDSEGSPEWMDRWPRLFGAGAAGARGMLSTIAGSMMTVVGITFSMTLVTLALASSQYTSRILRNFMRDRVTQVVLGIFAGIFSYCLIVLRTIRGGEENGFIPSLSVTFGVVLAIGGIAVLIFFIHHIASSIQASNIIASVAGETMKAVERLFPGRAGRGNEGDAEDRSFLRSRRTWQAVPAPSTGYIQSIDTAALLRAGRKHETIVRMESGVGEFVVAGRAIVSVARDDAPTEAIVADVQKAYGIDRYRTVEQDAAFGIRQIVDMALRALSPGINDTTTAVTCLDYLAAILARLSSRRIPSPCRREGGVLRLIGVGPTYASLVAESFDEVRVSAEGNVAVLLRILGALETLGGLEADPGRRSVLREHVAAIAETAARTIASPRDRGLFESRLERVRDALEPR